MIIFFFIVLFIILSHYLCDSCFFNIFPPLESRGQILALLCLPLNFQHPSKCLTHSRDLRWRGKWQPAPVFSPGESQGWRSLVGHYGVAQSRTRLKWLSSSSSRVLRNDCWMNKREDHLLLPYPQTVLCFFGKMYVIHGWILAKFSCQLGKQL